MLVTLETPMIRLDLDLSEWTLLHDLLAASIQTDSAGHKHGLLDKLLAAHTLATITRTCPVCRQSFTQLKTGRPGHYCSNACRQKAYRLRNLAFKRSVLGRRP